MGKIAVAEASDAIPVRTTVPEELGKAEERRSSEMIIRQDFSESLSKSDPTMIDEGHHHLRSSALSSLLA